MASKKNIADLQNKPVSFEHLKISIVCLKQNARFSYTVNHFKSDFAETDIWNCSNLHAVLPNVFAR